MFPTPIAKTAPWVQRTYKWLLPIALILWLLPLIGIAVTSIRPSSDLAAGNYFGWPSGFNFIENYSAVFENSNIGWYILNSFKVTIPTVIGAVGLSCLTGYALAVYKFRSNLLVFFMFVAGNFVPFQILAIPVRDLTLNLGMYNTTMGLVMFHVAFQTGFCTLFMRNFIKGLPFALIESARVEGVSEWKIFWHIVMPLMRPAIAALAVLIFTRSPSMRCRWGRRWRRRRRRSRRGPHRRRRREVPAANWRTRATPPSTRCVRAALQRPSQCRPSPSPRPRPR